MNDLLAQLDSRNETVQAESANVLKEMNLNAQADAIESKPKQDAKSRFNARQARKAAALAESYSPDDPAVQARLEKEAREELSAIEKVCNELNLEMYEINPDGHCLFSAVADQLNFLGILPPEKANYAYTRAVAADYIYSHPDDFIPFLPSAEGEDSSGALDAGLMSPEDFKKYCLSMRDTAIWGGEPEIVALTRAFNVPIHVVQGGQPPIVVHNPVGKESDIHDQGVVRISYHRKLYGLGEHYNSLRTKPRKIPIS
ncbi:cysteine proteinase [Agrocybe pediades]|nr:cysteine proteinase [Agrocybe pediades]